MTRRHPLPRQSSAQVDGRLAERWFAASLPAEWILQRPTEDFGLDGTVLVAEGDGLTPLEFGVQIKSSKAWRYRTGSLAVEKLSTRTVRYWFSRLTPTMLVAFDSRAQRGYWGWVFDLVDPKALDQTDQDTMTLHIQTTSELTEAAWSIIRRRVARFYDSLQEGLHTAAAAAHVVPLVHELAVALRLLHAAASAPRQTEEDGMKADISEVTAYHEVVLAVSRFRESTPPGQLLHDQLGAWLATLRDELSTCYHPVDMLFDPSRRTAATWAAEDALVIHRPRILRLVLDLMIGVTRSRETTGQRLMEGLFDRLWERPPAAAR